MSRSATPWRIGESYFAPGNLSPHTNIRALIFSRHVHFTGEGEGGGGTLADTVHQYPLSPGFDVVCTARRIHSAAQFRWKLNCKQQCDSSQDFTAVLRLNVLTFRSGVPSPSAGMLKR